MSKISSSRAGSLSDRRAFGHVANVVQIALKIFLGPLLGRLIIGARLSHIGLIDDMAFIIVGVFVAFSAAKCFGPSVAGITERIGHRKHSAFLHVF